MRISQLTLTNFRNYSKRTFSFDPELTLVVGPNGSGKTNILEAIYLLATGESWRAGASEEMVAFKQEVAHVEGTLSSERDSATRISRVGRRSTSGLSETPTKALNLPLPIDTNGVSVPSKQDSRIAGTRLHVVLTHGIVNGARVAKVKYKVDAVAKLKSDFVGRLKVVLFEPQSLMIVIGDPEHRRRFLDEVLCQTDAEYRNDLHVYARALKVRNRLLNAIREGKAQREQLDYWERTMVKHGTKIQETRRLLVEWINGQIDEVVLMYEPSVMSEERLTFYREREVAAGFTLVGPQRDDFQIVSKDEGRGSSTLRDSDPNGLKAEGKSLAQFGSRGAQRMAVLKLKLAEALWIEGKTGESPVLLLDDIYSELDDEHDQMVGELVYGRQTIITTTEKPSADFVSNQIIRL